MNAPHKPEPPAPSELPDLSERPPFFGTGFVYPALLQTDEERRGALERLFSLADLAARSADPVDEIKMTRDEMHER